MTPFYQHLQGVPGFGLGTTVDQVGALAAVGVGAAFAAHGVISTIKRRKDVEAMHRGPDLPEPPSGSESAASGKGGRS
jgi:hypothetical protein